MEIPIAVLNVELLAFFRKNGQLVARVEYEDGDDQQTETSKPHRRFERRRNA